MPKFLVIPDVLCNAISTNNSNQSSCPVVTLHGQKLVDGYFSSNSISSNVAKFTSSVDRVKGNLKDRYRIPRVDPTTDPSSSLRKFSNLETMSYLNALFLDIIPKNLSVVWSRIIRRNVKAPERFAVTSATAQEMLKLRRDFISDTYKVIDRDEKEYTEKDIPGVSSCMSSFHSAHFPLPHIATVVNQTCHRHLELEKAMIDSGSQI